jgi:hypothetical protein
MNKPAVFVSSTCYDLKQVRSDIKQFLEGLGLEPLLSEYNSFPVSPELGTVDNCIKAVESRADIFVLIIGARYGSTTDLGESITNLELLAAKAKGIPVYAFVMRSILNILPVWQSNPDADYSSVVDSSKLLKFIADLQRTKETWVFPFDTAQEIFDALKAQFANLFMDALALRLRVIKAGGLSPRFKDLPGSALRLLVERPSYWEYLLFAEVLDSGIKSLADLKRDWQYRLALGPGTRTKPSDFLARVQDKYAEAQRVVANLEALFNVAWPAAIGPPGKPADPEAIVYVAERIAAVYRDALDWKLDFERLRAPEELGRLKSLASCLCDNMVAEVEEYSSKLKALTSEAVRAARLGQKVEVNLTLTLTAPDLTEYMGEVRRVTDLCNSGALERE